MKDPGNYTTSGDVNEKLSAHDYWPLLWGGLLIAPGVYFLLASFNDGWPLFGRMALKEKQAAERAEEERLAANREEALHILNLYVRSSFIAKTSPELRYEQFFTWLTGLRQFVIAAFGDHEDSCQWPISSTRWWPAKVPTLHAFFTSFLTKTDLLSRGLLSSETTRRS